MTFQTVVSFNNWGMPQGGANSGFFGPTTLVQGTDGRLYATTQGGGCAPGGSPCGNGSGSGTVFALTTGGQLSTIHVFQPSDPTLQDGQYPQAGIIPGPNGLFYGTAQQGGSTMGKALGVVFSISPSGDYNIIYRFPSTNNDPHGSQPLDGLLFASNGALYGQTSGGGANGCGTIFQITPSGTLTTLYDHPGTAYCGVGGGEGNMIQGSDGNIYGTYRQGGTGGYGFIFKIVPASGQLITLYNFQGGCTDGAYPEAGLVQGNDGNLYGTTSYGGAYCVGGTIFRIAPTGQGYTILHSFSDPGAPAADGFSPSAPLIQAKDGNFYGTTLRGGTGKCSASTTCGTIFLMTPSGALTTLYDFDYSANNSTGPWSPAGGLLQAADGSFYGMTTRGGVNSGDPTCGGYGCGTVYHLVVSSVVSISEVDNGFSNVPNSPIQSGSWVVIKGTNLSTNPGRGWNANESFPTSMDGTSVTINSKPAFLYFISPGQLNLQAPTDSTVGPVTVVVTNNGVTSEATAHYQSSSPALLQWNGGQYPYAEITRGSDYIGNPAVIPGTVSAKAGDILTLWATGLGDTNPPLPAGQQPTTFPSVNTVPMVTVGGFNATVFGAVLRYAGLYQANIQLPASLPAGDQQIKLIQGSYQSPDGVLINVSP